MSGYEYSEWLGQLHFWLTFIGVNLIFPSTFLGLAGMQEDMQIILMPLPTGIIFLQLVHIFLWLSLEFLCKYNLAFIKKKAAQNP